MATRWPEAVPTRTVTSSEVTEGLVTIFTRTGMPMRLLSDRGSVFMGRVVRKCSEMLGIDTVSTSP